MTPNEKSKADYLKIKICYKQCRVHNMLNTEYLNYAFEITFDGDGEDPCEAQFLAFMLKWKTTGVFKYKGKFIPFHHIIDIETLST